VGAPAVRQPQPSTGTRPPIADSLARLGVQPGSKSTPVKWRALKADIRSPCLVGWSVGLRTIVVTRSFAVRHGVIAFDDAGSAPGRRLGRSRADELADGVTPEPPDGVARLRDRDSHLAEQGLGRTVAARSSFIGRSLAILGPSC
jgi:hypothetical protein